jgi:ribosomal-protein-alanine N-acetyltransferase
MQIVKADGFKKQYALTYLMKIEYSCFTSDFVTRKDFKHNYDRTNFLLDIDNIIVGYYMWYSENDYAYLYSLAIDKYYQGNGYSKLLLDHFLTNSKYNKHCLHVNPSNIIAIQLYRNYNFKNIGYFNNFYEDGAPAILMQRE